MGFYFYFQPNGVLLYNPTLDDNLRNSGFSQQRHHEMIIKIDAPQFQHGRKGGISSPPSERASRAHNPPK